MDWHFSSAKEAKSRREPASLSISADQMAALVIRAGRPLSESKIKDECLTDRLTAPMGQARAATGPPSD